MQADGLDWYKLNYLISLYLIILLSGIILIVDTAKPITPIPNRQICTKIQSMLSNGKYQTHQMSSNITYVSRTYAQNFLAYSPPDDLLIFVEPKHQLHVYNAQSVDLIVNISTTDVVYAGSCISLSNGDRHNIFFVYESRIRPHLVSIRVCEVRFNILNLNFEDQICIETLTIRCEKSTIRIHGFTIKHNHAETNKSILFISTDNGLIYAIFDMHNNSLIHKPVILNDTLSEGSVVVTSSGIVYYANKDEHTIHEIHITQDFRIRYGKIIKSNAIRSPFGLTTDECNHLYIATKSMILIMSIQTYKTIRSVFSKASDLPITMERLNSTTYVYSTVKKSSGRISPTWMFNFLYFTDPYKPVITTQHPVDHMDNTYIPIYSSMPKLSPSITTDATRTYTQSSSALEMSEQTQISSSIEEETSSTDRTTLNTLSLSTEYSTSISSKEFQDNSPDDSPHFDNSSLLNEVHVTTQSSSDYNTSSENIKRMSTPAELLTSDIQGKLNASFDENTLVETNLTPQSSSESNPYTQHINYSTDPMETIEYNDPKLTSVISFTTSHTTLHRTDSSIDDFDKYRDNESTQQTTDIYEEKSTFSPLLSTEDFNEYLHSPNSTSISLEVTASNLLSSETYSNIDRTDRPSENVLNTDMISSILPSNVFDENTTPFSDINDEHRTVGLSSTNIDEILLNETSRTTPDHLFDIDVDHSSSHSLLLSTTSEQLVSQIQDEQIRSPSPKTNDVTIFTIPHETNSLQNQSHLMSSKTDDLYNESQMTTYEPSSITQNSIFPMIATDDVNKEIDDRNSQNDSLSMLAEFNVSSTLHSSLSSFIVSSTTLVPSRSSHLSSPFRSSLAHSSTISTKSNRLLSSKYFSVPTTPDSIPDTTLSSSSMSTLQTSETAITSDITEQSSITTSSDESSSPLMTSYLTHTSLAAPVLSTTIDDQLTSQYLNSFFETSLTYTISSEPSTTDYETSSTTIITSMTTQTDESSTLLSTTTDDEENFSTTDFVTPETTLVSSTFSSSVTDNYSEEYTPTRSSLEVPSTSSSSITEPYSEVSSTFSSSITNEYTEQYTSIRSSLEVSSTFSPTITNDYSEEYISTQSSLEVPSTTFSDVYNSKTEHSTLVITTSSPRSARPTRRRTTRSTTSTTTISTTTTDLFRTRKQKITRLQSKPSTTTTLIPSIPTTSISNQFLTSSPISIWYPKLNSSEEQRTVVIKPSLDSNSSNTLLSNELFNTLFDDTTNSSSEKSIYFNLIDLPPSSWNLSLHTNDSVLLDIVLPSPSHATTNLTITNIEANRFSANIIGVPVNLQVDQIQVKEFSLAMNLTNNQTNQSLSEVVIGHVRSERFQLDITKSDNMNIRIEQVDSETAELFFDSQFCTNETNLQINLNLSKNGTIRYGNRTPIRIGPVFTRVHMLKQSCDLDQPFTLFFDICQAQNPCLNGGTCKSHIPDYDNPSYSPQESSEINYQCICPLYISGEHCQYSKYPFGYCINSGTLIYTLDVNNKSIEKCLCASGFQGHHCENNIDDCIGIRCSNHGICQDRINAYTCSCFDGFYGNECEQKNVQTVLLQVASKSFATVAILLIAGIAGLVVASDIHTYLTRKKETTRHRVYQFPRATSELFENSVLLLGFGDAPIEMRDLSTVNRGRKRKTMAMRQHKVNKRRQTSYQQLPTRKYKRTVQKTLPRDYLLSNPTDETIL